jgi:hypothetical protein
VPRPRRIAVVLTINLQYIYVNALDAGHSINFFKTTKNIMSKRTFQFVTTIIGGLSTVAAGCVTYYVEDNQMAAAIVSSIGIAVTSVEAICSKFVKDEPAQQ